MSTTETEFERSTAPESTSTLYAAVASAAYRFSRALLGENPAAASDARATLSRVRRAAGIEPGQDPLTWSLVMEQVLPALPDRDIGRGPEPTNGEWAAFTAITMFALHQQSNRSPMHAKGRSVGHAVGELKVRSGSGSIKSRFDALLVATTPKSIQYQLRSIVSLLNAYEIPLDYGRLAEDLKWLRTARGRTRVTVMWGRNYVQALYPKTQ